MNSDTLIIERVLSLKDQSPFILIQDNFSQSSRLITNEILTRCNILESKSKSSAQINHNIISNLIYLGYDTSFAPGYVKSTDLFIDCLDSDGDTELGINSIINKIQKYLSKKVTPINNANKKPDESSATTGEPTTKISILQSLNETTSQTKKTLIILDSLNYIKSSTLVSVFLSRLAQLNKNNNLIIMATLHKSIIETGSDLNRHSANLYPSKENLLNYLATTVLNVEYYYSNTNTDIDEEEVNADFTNRFYPSLKLNKDSFVVNLIKFKKTGKKSQYNFLIDTDSHKVVLMKDLQNNENGEMGNEDLLKGLSTFNLTTSLKQQKARDNVDLPFLDAQNFQNGGAIVYQFEKDDDYDEEDPYEDPF